MNHWKLLISLLFLSSNSICQGINNLWLMGYQGGGGGVNFDFSGGSLIVDSFTRKMSFLDTDASICDKNGNILFYTNGIWVANSAHDTMLNGSGLDTGYLATQYQQFGLPIPQGALIIPFPVDSEKYYIFHETVNDIFNVGFPERISYSVVDMTLDNGFGALSSKNNILFSDTLAGCELTATKHGNGRDWWLIQHEVGTDTYFKFLITPLGISGPFYQHIGVVRQTGLQAVFSVEGNKYGSYQNLDDLEIFDFDRCTGIMSNHVNVNINDSMVGGGIAFSPSGRYLYVSSVQYVYQFDLQATNISSSKQTVAFWDGTYSPAPPFAALFSIMQLAPDGKIYIACGNSTVDMHVINYPDSAGLACDLQQHSVHLPHFNGNSLPNHPNYFLGRDVGSPCDSLTAINTYNNTVIPIRINPNPAQNTFYLNYELPYGKTAIATVYNTLGEVVMRKALYWYFGYLQIDCSSLINGVYFIQVEGKGIGGSAKVVIMR